MLEWIILGIIAVLALALVLIYNGLITTKGRTQNAWAQIDVQLQKRYDLVPNLVETVKGYAKHEKSVFTEVTTARASLMSAGGIAEKAKANDMLSGALKSLFAVAENYPQLRASENFKMLQEQLDGIESKIAYARQFYNDSVLDYNIMIKTIPYNVLASMLNYKDVEYFGTEEKEARKAVKVKF